MVEGPLQRALLLLLPVVGDRRGRSREFDLGMLSSFSRGCLKERSNVGIDSR